MPPAGRPTKSQPAGTPQRESKTEESTLALRCVCWRTVSLLLSIFLSHWSGVCVCSVFLRVSLLTGERRAVRSYVCPLLASCPFVRAYGERVAARVHTRGSGNRSDEEDLRFRRVCACVRARGNDHTDECRLLSLTEPLREVSLPRTEMEAETKGRRRRQGVVRSVLDDRNDRWRENRRLRFTPILHRVRWNFRSDSTAILYSYVNPEGIETFCRQTRLLFPRVPRFVLPSAISLSSA